MSLAISVVIPVHNGERYLAEAVESVLGQSRPPSEVIVVDDGSTDGSADIARRYAPAVSYARRGRGGPGAARNLGADLAQGELLAFLDADDLWLGRKLEIQAAALDRDKALDMVFGRVEQFISPDNTTVTQGIRKAVEASAGQHVGAMLIRRASFFRAGPFPTDLRVGEFIEWHARALDRGLTAATLPDIVLKRRIHASNLVRRESDTQGEYLRVVKSILDRRRGFTPGPPGVPGARKDLER